MTLSSSPRDPEVLPRDPEVAVDVEGEKLGAGTFVGTDEVVGWGPLDSGGEPGASMGTAESKADVCCCC